MSLKPLCKCQLRTSNGGQLMSSLVAEQWRTIRLIFLMDSDLIS